MNIGEFLRKLNAELKASSVECDYVVRLIIDGAHYTINFREKWLRDGDVVGCDPKFTITASTLSMLLSYSIAPSALTSDSSGIATVEWIRFVLQ